MGTRGEGIHKRHHQVLVCNTTEAQAELQFAHLHCFLKTPDIVNAKLRTLPKRGYLNPSGIFILWATLGIYI